MSNKISKHFSLEEMSCKCGKCDTSESHMDEEFLGLLDDLRDVVNRPIVPSSAYRCPEYNNEVSSTGYNGVHTMGNAVDIPVSYANAYDMLVAAMGLGFAGVGIKQNGPGNLRFLHLDTLEDDERRPRVWSY